jgi:hypothetical protein
MKAGISFVKKSQRQKPDGRSSLPEHTPPGTYPVSALSLFAAFVSVFRFGVGVQDYRVDRNALSLDGLGFCYGGPNDIHG